MTIVVKLMKPNRGPFFVAHWKDPVTDLKKTRSTKARKRRDAERFAARLEDQLNSGENLTNPAKTTWDYLRGRFTRELLDSQAIKTKNKAISALNSLEKMKSPHFVSAITASLLSEWAAELRKAKIAEYTIKGYLVEIGRMLSWGRRMGLVRSVPELPLPKRLGGTKSRGVTDEEFARMIAALPVEVGPACVASWEFLLRGLWLSGLRLSEAINLHWEDSRLLCVDTSGDSIMLRIQAAGQKSGEFQLLPLAPEFQAFLLAVPEAERTGFVFNPRPMREPIDVRLQDDWVGKVIAMTGKAADVQVAKSMRKGKERVKYATAHDLRRAFGDRWAPRVSTAVLKELMRHKSISTTEKFYMRLSAEKTATIAMQAFGNASGNTSLKSPSIEQQPPSQPA